MHYLIVQRRGGYTPAIYGPFASKDEAELFASYSVPSDCDYWHSKSYAVTETEMADVKIKHALANARADREDARAI